MAQWLKKKSTCNAGDIGDVGQKDPLEEDMVTHSSILAGKIPWTKERGRPLSMGCEELDTTVATDHRYHGYCITVGFSYLRLLYFTSNQTSPSDIA